MKTQADEGLTTAHEAGYVFLRQPQASKLANLFRLPVPGLSRLGSESVPKALFRDLSPWTLVSKPISVLLPGQPAEHQLNHADLDLRFAGISQMLIVLAVNSAPTQPGKGPLYHPPPRQQLKPSVPSRTADDLKHIPPVLRDPSVQGVIVILGVCPELLQARERFALQLAENLRRRRRIIHGCAGDGHGQEQPYGIHGDMVLPTRDPLGTVVTMLATPLGRLDGLAIDAAGTGRGLPTGSSPDSTAEGVIDGFPGAVSFPRREEVVDGDWRQLPSARQLVRRFRDQAALRTGSGNLCSGRTPSRRQASSSPFRRAASSAAKASTPCGDQLIPWCLQRADTAQSLYFSTRVLAIHNPARCRCW